jgi:uncharacterized Zn-finger protein
MSTTNPANATPHNLTGATPNDKSHYDVMQKDLPLHCPLPSMSLWNSHPKVYLPIEATGKAKCPYCGTEYQLIDR